MEWDILQKRNGARGVDGRMTWQDYATLRSPGDVACAEGNVRADPEVWRIIDDRRREVLLGSNT
jgi:hypothetical protein